MAHRHHQRGPATGAQKPVRWPALSLEDPRAGRNGAYTRLFPGDDLYAAAAWAYHFSKSNRESASGLLYALAEAWPQKPRHDRQVGERMDLVLLARRRQGFTVEQLAKASGQHPDSVRRRLREAVQAVEDYSGDAEPVIYSEPSEGQEPEPPRPEHWLRLPVDSTISQAWRSQAQALDTRLEDELSQVGAELALGFLGSGLVARQDRD